MREFADWIKSMVDANESPSFGRAAAGFVVYFLVLWGCYLVSKNNIIPNIPESWLVLIGLLWGTTAAKEAYTKAKEIIANASPPPNP